MSAETSVSFSVPTTIRDPKTGAVAHEIAVRNPLFSCLAYKYRLLRSGHFPVDVEFHCDGDDVKSAWVRTSGVVATRYICQ